MVKNSFKPITKVRLSLSCSSQNAQLINETKLGISYTELNQHRFKKYGNTEILSSDSMTPLINLYRTNVENWASS
jgi:hypothetical protein